MRHTHAEDQPHTFINRVKLGTGQPSRSSGFGLKIRIEKEADGHHRHIGKRMLDQRPRPHLLPTHRRKPQRSAQYHRGNPIGDEGKKGGIAFGMMLKKFLGKPTQSLGNSAGKQQQQCRRLHLSPLTGVIGIHDQYCDDQQ